MAFSVITCFPMLLVFSGSASSYAWHAPGYVDWDFYGIIAVAWLPAAPVIEDSRNSILLLSGMIQSGFLANILTILHVNYKIDIFYARLATAVFVLYLIIRMTNAQSILLPKLPLKLHKKSIAIISIFFFSTGCFMLPYTPYLNLFLHFYIYLLCVETSIMYYTKEFRLFSRFPRPECKLFHRAYHITVHRCAPTNQTASKN